MQAVPHLRVEQPKMLGCQQWSGESEVEWRSRCRKCDGCRPTALPRA